MPKFARASNRQVVAAEKTVKRGLLSNESETFVETVYKN